VDSTVTAVLVHKAIGEALTCIFVDNGLLRAGEREKVEEMLRNNFHINLKVVDASERFLKRLKGVRDLKKREK
jgi:GMP synthase (glutamine-hydrolyzing) (EC 6.3.5.2)